LGSAIGVGCLITAGVISTSRLIQDRAAWYDWLIISGCALSSCIASSIVLSDRWRTPIQQNHADEWRIYHSESELSYMNWHDRMIARSHARYQDKDIQSLLSLSPDSVDTPLKHDIPSDTSRAQREDCRDLAILDTQWAELCDRQAEWRYLYLLKQGIPPQEAFTRVMDLSNSSQSQRGR
jgi:hypothetical protein